MCVEKDEFKKLAEIVAKVKHDTGNIRQTQTALGVSVNDIEKHLKNLNSRTSKVEDKVANLEDPEFREVRCIQKEVIERIDREMLTVQKFEEWERKKEQARKDEEDTMRENELLAVKVVENRQRQMQWVVGLIVGTGTIIMTLIGYLS